MSLDVMLDVMKIGGGPLFADYCTVIKYNKIGDRPRFAGLECPWTAPIGETLN